MPNYFGRLAAFCFGAALCAATTGSAQIYSAVHVFSSAAGFSAPLAQGPDGTLYGVSAGGGAASYGTVFKVQPDGTGFGIIYSFTNGSDGSGPVAGLVLSGNTLYGTAANGGSAGSGTVFKVNIDGSGFAAIYGFSANIDADRDGATPKASLVLAGGTLYGTASDGGGHNRAGTVFKVNTDGTGFTNLFNFSVTNGAYPLAGMVLSGSTLYGTTQEGGTNGSSGTVFKINTDGTGFGLLHQFGATLSGTNSDGAILYAGVVLSGGTLYGTASGGGAWPSYGTVFRVNTDGTGFTNLYNFMGGTNGAKPMGGLVLSDGTLYGTTYQGGVSPGYGTVFKLNADGTGYTNLYSFRGYDSTDGSAPEAGLVLSGNTLYGTALQGGGAVNGTVFRVNTDGTGFAVLSDGSDGAKPQAGLVLSGSTFYGTTAAGGLSGNGTVFRVNTNGTSFATLYAFTAGDYESVSGVTYYTNTDGSTPMGTLVLSGGSLYGTARVGGRFGVGTVFRLNTDGTGFTNLYTFTNGMDGALPMAGLVLSGSTLYGTASAGGGGLSGTVFQINTNGTGFALVHTFSAGTVSHNIYTNADGAIPSASLLLAGDTLYGTTYQGGPLGGGTLFKVNTNGTGFTNFYNFIAPPNGGSTSPDGAYPAGRLILSGNTLYGTASGGGIESPKTGITLGTLFKVNTDGTGFVRLHLFSDGYDGAKPAAGLTLSGSTLYGTAAGVQIPGKGTLFQVSTDGLNFTTLHTFDFQGGTPAGDLVLVGNTLYGTSEFSAAGSGSGTVFAVTPSPTPSIQFTASPTNGIPPQTVQFNAPGVDDKGNPISFWNWNFGDGSTNTSPNPVHTYTNNGPFTPTLIATNNNGSTIIGSGPVINVVYPGFILNGGFETGTFTNWTGSGNLGGRSIATVSTYVHSGTRGAQLSASGSLGYLSQTLSTTPGVVYSISFWLRNPTSKTNNEFLVSWNGNVLLDMTNLPVTGWTNIQLAVTATAGTAVLQFGYRNDTAYFGLDDISVTSAQPLGIAGISLSGTNLVVSGINGQSNGTYYVLMSTNVAQPLNQWTPVATNVLNANGNFIFTATNAVTPNAPQRFFILQVQ